MNLIEQVASDPVVDQAFAWLCHSRRKQHHNRDVWWLRFHWARERPRIQQDLLAGTYRFDAVQIYRTSEGAFESWSARDALVLKALAIVLGGHLRLSERCGSKSTLAPKVPGTFPREGNRRLHRLAQILRDC